MSPAPPVAGAPAAGNALGGACLPAAGLGGLQGMDFSSSGLAAAAQPSVPTPLTNIMGQGSGGGGGGGGVGSGAPAPAAPQPPSGDVVDMAWMQSNVQTILVSCARVCVRVCVCVHSVFSARVRTAFASAAPRRLFALAAQSISTAKRQQLGDAKRQSLTPSTPCRHL